MTKRRVKREPVVQPQDQSIRYIPLTQGQVAIVSAHRYGFLSQWNWHAKWSQNNKAFYAERNERREKQSHKHVKMHAVITETDEFQIADHINGNTLDNRDENLRKCYQVENAQNHKVRKDCKSGYSGVYYSHKKGGWIAVISSHRKRIFLGQYIDKQQAIKARKSAEAELHGEFARKHHEYLT